ncbi:hypothetical protein NL676_006286 [Syzygium grande]|nr:hypothetical protein NL676_006286 [Syzygium grande]
MPRIDIRGSYIIQCARRRPPWALDEEPALRRVIPEPVKFEPFREFLLVVDEAHGGGGGAFLFRVFPLTWVGSYQEAAIMMLSVGTGVESVNPMKGDVIVILMNPEVNPFKRALGLVSTTIALLSNPIV